MKTPDLRPSPSSCLRALSLCLLLLVAPLAQAASPTPGDTSTLNNRGAWLGTNSYAVNDLVTYNGGTYVNTAATYPLTTTSTSPGPVNLFDKGAVTQDIVIVAGNGAAANIGGFQTSGFINVSGATSFVTNITVNIFDPYGIAFYDANKRFVAGTLLKGYKWPAGAPIPVPTGAFYVRFWWQLGVMGTTLDAAVLNTGITLQTTYSSFGVPAPGTTTSTTIPSAAPTDTTHWQSLSTSSGTPPLSGKKMFLLGDSIVWAYPDVARQIASAIGVTLSSKGATAPGVDAVPGRAFDTFTNGQSGSSLVPVSQAVLADVDLMVIALGTNQDSGVGIGTAADAPSLSGSMSAQMRSMLETIMGWRPGMRIVVVGPYQSNRYNVQSGTDGIRGSQDSGRTIANPGSLAVLRSINTAMKAVCDLYSIPYVDMYSESGVNFSTSALWLSDGLHPNGAGYSSFYIPYIAAQLPRFIR